MIESATNSIAAPRNRASRFAMFRLSVVNVGRVAGVSPAEPFRFTIITLPAKPDDAFSLGIDDLVHPVVSLPTLPEMLRDNIPSIRKCLPVPMNNASAIASVG